MSWQSWVFAAVMAALVAFVVVVYTTDIFCDDGCQRMMANYTFMEASHGAS